MERTPLFRAAAVAATRAGEHGRIVLAAPITLRWLASFFAALAVVLGAVAYFGSYTTHRTLRGRLVTERSSMEIRSPQLGTIVERRVSEGQRVQRGDVLYVVSSERTSSARGATQEQVGEQLDERRRSIVEQIATTRALAAMDRNALDASAAALAAEAARLEETIRTQTARADLAREAAARYERVRAQGFVSEDQLAAKRADLLEQRGRLGALEREQAAAARELADLRGRLATTGARYDNQVAELRSGLAETELQIAENEARRAIVITAPDAGAVTGIAADVGDLVDTVAALAVIVPIDSGLRAALYAPSRAAGFLAAGQPVQLRYDAYPFQKFGHQRGRVLSVSETVVGRAALHAPERGATGIVEPMYEVIVALDRQTITAYGEPRALRAGMIVEADVLLEKRRLYEWVLEPLYAVAKR